MRHAIKEALSDKRETGIFKQNWFETRKKQAESEILNGCNILKWDETTISVEVKIDQNWKKERLFLIYVNFGIGNITFNFWPKAVNKLLINLVVYKKLFIGNDSSEKRVLERDFIRELLLFQRRQSTEKNLIREDAKKVVTLETFKKATPGSKFLIFVFHSSLKEILEMMKIF